MAARATWLDIPEGTTPTSGPGASAQPTFCEGRLNLNRISTDLNRISTGLYRPTTHTGVIIWCGDRCPVCAAAVGPPRSASDCPRASREPSTICEDCTGTERVIGNPWSRSWKKVGNATPSPTTTSQAQGGRGSGIGQPTGPKKFPSKRLVWAASGSACLELWISNTAGALTSERTLPPPALGL